MKDRFPIEVWAPIFRRLLHSICIVLALSLFLTTPTFAQITTGSLSGTVDDSTGAVIPKADITLTNEATGDHRTTVSNSVGYFTFAAVQSGTYTVTVSAAGFGSWKQTGIVMNSGDVREVPQIRLQVGAAAQSVSVSAEAAQLVPTDSGERADVITSKDLEKLSIEGRNVSELLKILPGVTSVPNGTSGGSSVDFSAEAPVGGSVGNGYSPSGAPYRGGTSFMLDGANIIDPGCSCYSIAVPNPDMTAEVKVQQSFGADTPNGPIVINSTSKNGGDKFHGEAYFYARNQSLNSNTWLNNYQGTAKPDGQYYYPGGNIGGPILIPHTPFDKPGKLFFWAGYEYYKQTLPTGAPLESYVPSAGMLAGNFTSTGSGNGALCPSGFSSTATNWCNDLTGAYDASGNAITNPAAITVDPGATALAKMFPAANANPATVPGGYNYVHNISNIQNGYVYRGRVDYNINESNKIFATYQEGKTTFITPSHVYYTPSYSVAYPGGNITQPVTSRVATLNMVNVLTPTLTNEFVFGWGWANEPYSPTNLQAIYKSTLGYTYSTVYNTASSVAPSINSAGAMTFPDLSQPAFYTSSGSYPLAKAVPSFADNITKVWRSHTFKFGAFTELVSNSQGTYSFPNGQFSFGSQPLPNNVTGSTVPTSKLIGSNNPTANFVMGIASSFSQNSSEVVQDVAYRTTAAYLLDNWKVTSKLTVNVGVRFDHIGRWYDRQGLGMAVWLPQLYAQDVAANQAAKSMVVEYPGIRWHGIDSSLRNSGSPVDFAYSSPRIGFAYDLNGNGKEVLRGGWGEYVWNDQPYGNQLATSQNMQTYTSPSGQAITFSQVGLQAPSGNPLPAGAATAADYNDHLMPTTYAYNVTSDTELPWHSLLEIAYVGNSTSHMLMGGQSDSVGIGGTEFSNLNKIAVGGLFKADPVTGAAAPTDPDNTSTYSLADYEPYSGCVSGGSCYGYGTNSLTVQEHVGYSNYNGLQVAWMKQAGRLSFNFNYTWSKSLGIISSTVDAFTVHGNYGIESIDRPQVFNSSYAYSLGDVYHGNSGLIKQAANGWTVSGITTFQSGGNLQAGYTQNLGLTIYEPTGVGNNTSGTTETLSTKTWFGTDQGSILPITTCDPTSKLQSLQKLNLSCFSAPAVGVQGPRQIRPYLSGPIYTDSDLTLYKTFNITEHQNIQFRASMFDFMNHSLWGFSGTNLLQLKYDTPDGGHSYTTNNSILGVSTTGSCGAGSNVWGCMNQKAPYSGAGYARIAELSLKYNF